MEVRSFKFPIYTSVACNRTPRCLDWGFNGFIIYGACHAVEVFKPDGKDSGQIVQTLLAHKKQVTSVQWISKPNNYPENELISTSADKSAIIWSLCNGQFVAKHILSGHKDIVKTANGFYWPSDNNEILLIATSGADSCIKIWERKTNDDDIMCVQTISFGNSFPLDVKMMQLDSSEVLLAVGGVDCHIRLYLHDDSKKFKCLATLEGHSDWIQSLDFIKDDCGDILLASASQDHFIRIWKMHLKSEPEESEPEVPGVAEISLLDAVFTTQSGQKYVVSLESVLAGHENWIYSVKWCPCPDSAQHLIILSASMDKTMIIWEPDVSSGIWMEKVRVGKIGGNTLGFYGGIFSPDGETIIAHGHQGAFHVWHLNKTHNFWEPGAAFGGHFNAVRDITWDPQGMYLLSCSNDQTTRLHAPVVTKSGKHNWCEIARPQVHGYDMTCIAAITRYKYVSAGDEKVVRVFESPRSFAENLQNLCKIDTSLYLKKLLPEGAGVPALGLSNKAIFEQDLKLDNEEENIQKHPKDQYPDICFMPVFLTEQPTEEILLQNTLWPEVQKLYGHPYEVYAVAVNHQGTVVASSCKASKPEHAVIILWSVLTWKQLGQLSFHTLTVTQLEFSLNDEYLLSVSRDRMWALYKHVPNETVPYKKVASTDKENGIHSRIIWSCSWSHDSKHFATVSRDKKVAIWIQNTIHSEEEKWSASVFEAEDAATAVAFAPCFSNEHRYILTVGLENGHILGCTWENSELNGKMWRTVFEINKDCAHHLTINKLKFSPVKGAAESKHNDTNVIQLASCSNDYHVRIYTFHIFCFS